jgi:hypothetical protein
MAKSVTSEKFQLKNVRASFVKIEEPEFFNPAAPGPGEKKKYRMACLLDPSNAEHAAAIAQIKKHAGEIVVKMFDGKKPKSLETCWGLGNELDKVYDGYKDMFYIKLATADRFPVVGRRRGADKKFIPLRPGDKEWPYNGCYVNVSATLWGQDSHGRKAINGNLLAIQFVEDGPAFGRPPTDANSEFDELPAGEGESAFDEEETQKGGEFDDDIQF